MQVTDPDLLSYIRHRLGDREIDSRQREIVRKALELNTPTPDFSGTFGHSTMPAYVGFVDLADFSTAVQGKTPDEIANYLAPFLQRLLEIVRGRGALVDKTVGDEVMFVLPETEEEAQPPEILFLGQLMGALHDLAYNMESRYRFRIGLAYGKVRFFCLEGSGYSEWTTVGETVHVAKRLHSLPELQNPNPVVGAFGMQVTEKSMDNVRHVMEQRLSIFAGFASRFEHQFMENPVPLKGVGKVLCSVLLPRPERTSNNSS